MFAQRAARSAQPVASRRSLASLSSLGKRTTLANVQSDSSTSSLTLVLKAGPRFEPAQGAAAVLKNLAFKVRPACVERRPARNHLALLPDRPLTALALLSAARPIGPHLASTSHRHPSTIAITQ